MRNFISKLFSRKDSGASFNPMDHDRMRDLMMGSGGGPSISGKMVTPDTAMGLSAVFSCWRVLSETIGAVPWSLYYKDPNASQSNAEKATDHPLFDLITSSPNANMTPVELKEAITLNLCQSGNAYVYKDVLPSGTTTALTPLVSRNVQPEFDPSTGGLKYKVLDRGVWTVVPQSNIWHVKGFGPNGLLGLSPLTAARESMGFAIAAEEFGARFFAQGGKPSGVISIPNFLTADQRKIARENLQQMLGSMSNMHKFALFEGGMKPEPWGDMPLQDMEFLLLRKFSVQEVCRFYRVPPHMVADLTAGASFASIEQMSQDFVMFTLLPYFTRIEASLGKWLLPAGQRRSYFLKFNFDSLLRADIAGRQAFYSSALQNGYMTRNEVRAKENLNRSTEEGMDDYTVQLNLSPIAKLARDDEAKRAAAPASASPPPVVEPPKAFDIAAAKVAAEAREAKHEQRLAAIIAAAPAPVINLPAINIDVPAPVVNLTVQKSGAMRTVVDERDAEGNILSTHTEEIPPKEDVK